MKILVTGAGGFIGGHLCKRLREDGHEVFGVDVKAYDGWWQHSSGRGAGVFDLRHRSVALALFDELSPDRVYHLASDMGGRGYIDTHESLCGLNARIDANVFEACAESHVKRLFLASSACVYNHRAKERGSIEAVMRLSLREIDVSPYDCDGLYGWQKLYGEFVAQAFAREGRFEARIGRLHGIYGPHGSWNDGREKAPAALCRKVAEAVRSGADRVTVWGDGTQRRSFLYIDDCVDAMIALMDSDCAAPLNIGSEECVTIDDLAHVAMECAHESMAIEHDPDRPVGVHARSSDNTKIRAALGWEPKVSLAEGIGRTYQWIEAEMDRPAQVREVETAVAGAVPEWKRRRGLA